ncbi:unnamed protein product [Cladocopium goreaui]|uniref:Uncharacterized protein n=1 Tax=Cladocopium goreaui TaxID=2562237 RepID=A0A9P1CAN0_9DINO|nr:unnamed protein product [Cladocopium goreaui]
MSLVESTAAFYQRCDEITSDGSLRVALDAQEIKNHSFQGIKIDQLVRADREMWTLLAQEVTGSLKMQGTVIPLDGHVTRLSTDPRVTMLLLPLPSSQRVTDAGDKPKPAVKPAPRPTPKNNSGKRKTRAERSCPEELRNYTTKDTLEDSGGEKEEHEAAFCAEALQEAFVSESETDIEMDETPKGDNPTVFTGASEELDKGYPKQLTNAGSAPWLLTIPLQGLVAFLSVFLILPMPTTLPISYNV